MTDHNDAGNPRESTYDLIVLAADRIAHHGVYASPQRRLEALVGSVLQAVDAGRGKIDMHEVLGTYHQMQSTRSAPDLIVNAISKLCRKAGYSIYVSSTKKLEAAPLTREARVTPITCRPARLFSVITSYASTLEGAPGETLVQHFVSREDRFDSLHVRADNAVVNPDVIPAHLWEDEQQLAKIIEVALSPATVTLAETVWSEAHQAYQPVHSVLSGRLG